MVAAGAGAAAAAGVAAGAPEPPQPEAESADADEPVVPGARLGRDEDGRPAWFVPDADRPGKYLKVAG